MSDDPKNEKVVFTSYQKIVVAILAFLQFTIILDFMILSPLGAVLIKTFSITPQQFALVVSGYAFAAGLSGILAAGFADKFDRKKLLLFFYTGFIIGTLLCALSPNYEFLLAARIVTGLFGGVIGSIVLAITTDLFSYQVRGRVMGVIQTAFAASQLLGIPAGLYLSNLWGWHAPFTMIVILGSIAGVFIWFFLKPIEEHLKLKTDKTAFRHLISTLTTKKYLKAFATVALLSTGGFMMMPFGSAFSVYNLKIPLTDLPLLYLFVGAFSIVAGPLIGRLSDKVGKMKTFFWGSILTMVMVVIYTNLGPTPFFWVAFVNALMFAGITGRMISSQAMISAIPEAASRGAFMSINSSIQQLSGGIASVIAGLIVSESLQGEIEHFDTLGYVVIGTTIITIFTMYFVSREIPASLEKPIL